MQATLKTIYAATTTDHAASCDLQRPVCVAKESLATKRRSHTPTLRLTILGCCLNCSSCHDTQEQARALQVAVEAATDRFERGEGGAFCRMLCTSVLEAAV